MNMSIDGLRVNHAALNQAAQDMYDTVKQIDGKLNDMEDTLRPERATWTGAAAEQYDISKAKWDRAIQEMRDLLDQSAATVYQSQQEYAAADARGRDRFMEI